MSEPTSTPTAPPAAQPAAQGEPAADKPLGENGEKALKAERDARSAAEKQTATLQKQLEEHTQMKDALAKALGITPEQGTPDVAVLAATVQTLQEQFTKSQHDNLVLNVATQNNITDPKRIETLSKITDEATLREVAAQFAQTPAATGTPSIQPGPRPDLSQGASGNPASGDPATDFANFLGAQMSGR